MPQFGKKAFKTFMPLCRSRSSIRQKAWDAAFCAASAIVSKAGV
jgi:hypothetical protein